MTNPVLDLFVLEASDYVEQLDGLLLQAGQAGPDSEEVRRVARALRGSATMAKLMSFADVAAGVERIAKGLHDGGIHWDPGTGAVMIAAVDDLKVLIHNVRAWSADDERRAIIRATELASHLPAVPAPAVLTPSASSGMLFFAAEATNIAAGLELLATRRDDADTAAQVLRRARALRGVAGVKDVPGLADVVDATEDAAKKVELGQGPLDAESSAVLTAAAPLLRRLATDLREGRQRDADCAEQRAFDAAVDGWLDREAAESNVVPIAELFYGDAGPHVLTESPHPPTSAEQRFGLELVSQAEHLRAVANAAQSSAESAKPSQMRAVRRALRDVGAVARSFGRADLERDARRLATSAAQGDLDFDALARFASALVDPEGTVVRQPAAEVRRPSTPMHTAAVEQSAPTPPSSMSSASNTAAKLDGALAALGRLAQAPLAEPVTLPESAIVPMSTLLYRGRAAIARAIEIRDAVRTAGRGGPDRASLDEMFDLLDLALTD